MLELAAALLGVAYGLGGISLLEVWAARTPVHRITPDAMRAPLASPASHLQGGASAFSMPLFCR
jgi:hypothetical protein